MALRKTLGDGFIPHLSGDAGKAPMSSLRIFIPSKNNNTKNNAR